MSQKMLVALAGNPNTGKTTLFNRLTGANQKVGNWPGVTVEKKSGQIQFDSKHVEVIDLPGVYDLADSASGLDEQIARQFIREQSPDLIINIVDGSNLKRNLMLTSQLKHLGIPVVLVLNKMDMAIVKGADINLEKLEEQLQLPVFSVVASKGHGLDDLIHYLEHFDAPLDTNNVVSEIPRADHLWAQNIFNSSTTTTNGRVSFSEKLDHLVLNKWLGIPIFLTMMYLMFTIAINVGAVFIDFFDILTGAFLVDGVTALLNAISMPQWITTLIANGVGGGIQLVATFIPVIAFLYLCLSILEDSGYMSRAAFIVDRLMAKIGLPGNAFVPLIVGFGCNVPSVMATRAIRRESDRLLVILMAPFMSCGARLTVYALFAAAFFPNQGQNLVFLLYLLGIALAVGTGWIFRKSLFGGKQEPSLMEMPDYHKPVWRNIFITTWHRLNGFITRAGKTIVLVVVALSFLNSLGTDGSFGNEDSKNSVLSEVGRTITPVFSPMGVSEENWPAAVGLFTGMFAKEAVVGTLDSLYQSIDVEISTEDDSSLDLLGATTEAFISIYENAAGLGGALLDPLGISIGDVSDQESVSVEQGVEVTTISKMQNLFDGELGAFCYLVFILLYAPCVAVLGAVAREAGAFWTGVVFTWSTAMAYVVSTSIYQLAYFSAHPLVSIIWPLAGFATLAAMVAAIRWRLRAEFIRKDIIAVG